MLSLGRAKMSEPLAHFFSSFFSCLGQCFAWGSVMILVWDFLEDLEIVYSSGPEKY